MALSDEQRAMLRLLAQREQGYDDIAALMGLSVGEVRAKVVGALAQLEAEGEPRPDVPPPFPVAGEEGATAAKAPAPAPVEPAAEPKAEIPKDPPASAPKAAPADAEEPPAAKPAAPKAIPAAVAASSGGSSGSGRTITIPSGRGLWPWIGGAVAIIVVVVVVILIAGGGSGGSSSTEASVATSPPASEETGTGEKSETAENASNPESSKEATVAVLKPVDGSSASGKATFGRIKNKLALLVEAEGLETTGKNDAYTIWLAQSENKMVPLASSPVEAKAKGKIAAQFEVKTEILAYLANGTFDQIYITHTDNAKLKTSVQEAVKKGAAPSYTGEAVLNGTVTGPIVGAALREEEAKEAEEKGE